MYQISDPLFDCVNCRCPSNIILFKHVLGKVECEGKWNKYRIKPKKKKATISTKECDKFDKVIDWINQQRETPQPKESNIHSLNVLSKIT